MKTAIKTLAIIGLVFGSLGLIGNIDDPSAFNASAVVVIPWASLCILALIDQGKK